MSTLDAKLEAAGRILSGHAPVLIAYSGGVDSATLLAIGVRTLGTGAQAVIADSPSLPRSALAAARAQAAALGANLRVISTRELDNPEYAKNPPNRCYFCKAELFQRMDALAKAGGFRALAYGENADDPPWDRPGSRAAAEFSVLAPLREAGLRKPEVRELARRFALTAADTPAQPCLSSRIPHGTPVSTAALAQVEAAEEAVRALGFRVLRVRHQQLPDGLLARVLVAPEELPRLFAMRREIVAAVQDAGYRQVEIDPEGYRGSLL